MAVDKVPKSFYSKNIKMQFFAPLRFLRCKTVYIIGLLSVICAQAQVQPVWQIGKFDESPVEFAPKAGSAVEFHVGASTPAKDWPGSQETGETYKVIFSLDSVDGPYTLKIGALIDRPRVPALRIEINGHSGKFFLHPKLSYSRSDFSYAFDPHESQSTIDVDVPASFLKKGENTLSITCEDDPATVPGEQEIGGLSYDALSLEKAPAERKHGADVTTDVEPTIFYKQSANGLTEVVDAFVRFRAPWKAGTATLASGGKQYTAKLAGGEFGEERTSFDVPEWTGAV